MLGLLERHCGATRDRCPIECEITSFIWIPVHLLISLTAITATICMGLSLMKVITNSSSTPFQITKVSSARLTCPSVVTRRANDRVRFVMDSDFKAYIQSTPLCCLYTCRRWPRKSSTWLIPDFCPLRLEKTHSDI